MKNNVRYNYQDKIVLVTGAATGIGKSTVKAFAESGATVVLSDTQVEKINLNVSEITASGGKALAIPCDVSVEKDVQQMIEHMINNYGRIDIAFNNAGVMQNATPLADIDNTEYLRIITTNLGGAWNCMKYQIREMLKQGKGIIVNTASTGALTANEGRSAYTASKHGILGLTKNAAIDYAIKGIRINAVCPGITDTPMLDILGSQKQEAIEQMTAQVPLGRMSTPEEIASAVLWLSSDAASSVIGHGLVLDGGYVIQ